MKVQITYKVYDMYRQDFDPDIVVDEEVIDSWDELSEILNEIDRANTVLKIEVIRGVKMDSRISAAAARDICLRAIKTKVDFEAIDKQIIAAATNGEYSTRIDLMESGASYSQRNEMDIVLCDNYRKLGFELSRDIGKSHGDGPCWDYITISW